LPLCKFELLFKMSSIAVNNNMGSDSCPALLENQIVMFSIIKYDTVFNVILSSDSKEEKVMYWNSAVKDEKVYTMRNTNACAFMEQFAYSSGCDKDGFRAQFQVRSRTGDYLYNFHYTNFGVVNLYKVGTVTDADEEVLVCSGRGGDWIKVLSAVM
jgi:hypothetical protein